MCTPTIVTGATGTRYRGRAFTTLRTLVYLWAHWYTSGHIGILLGTLVYFLGTLVYFWAHWYTSGHIGILLGTLVYFWAHWYTFGHIRILLGTLVYFWAHWYTFGHIGILLGTLVYFWAHWYTFGHIGILMHNVQYTAMYTSISPHTILSYGDLSVLPLSSVQLISIPNYFHLPACLVHQPTTATTA